jgi:hypothetical protein
MRSRSTQSGATLLYGPRSPRPDLVLAAQFLIDDLRAEGQRIGSLRVNEHTLRLRLDGLELALALSAAPLPLDALGAVLRLPPPPGGMAAGTDDGAEGAGLTDLRRIRTIRALRRHGAALGVLLRQRGAGPADMDAALHPMVLALIEAAPPGLVLWQPTGVVWGVPEFQAADPRALSAPGPALPRLDRLPAPEDPALRPVATEVVPVPPDRRGRAAGRSAGRIFEREGAGGRVVPLPRLAQPSARLVEALRDPPPGSDAAAATPPVRRRGLVGLVLVIWLALGLPPWPGLQAMLPGP